MNTLTLEYDKETEYSSNIFNIDTIPEYLSLNCNSNIIKIHVKKTPEEKYKHYNYFSLKTEQFSTLSCEIKFCFDYIITNRLEYDLLCQPVVKSIDTSKIDLNTAIKIFKKKLNLISVEHQETKLVIKTPESKWSKVFD